MAQPSPYPVSSHYRQSRQGQAQAQARHYHQPQDQPGAAGGHGARPVRPVAYGRASARPQPRQVLMAGGSMLALAALVITPRLNQSQAQQVEPFTCIKQEQTKALVSRDQLQALLEKELQSPKAAVQEVLKQPYCVLSPGKTQAGQPADREAYPLEFDPQTWLVVLYEGDRYAGYDFRFR